MQPHFPANLRLTNQKAILETLTPGHFPALLAIGLEPALWQYSNSSITTTAQLQAYLDKAMQEMDEGLSQVFAIIDKESGEMAGCTRYSNIVWEHKRLEIGWTWYLPRFQRTGLNRACKALLLAYAFETLDFNRVELKTSLLNIPSRTAIAKIGATQEGIFRSHQVLPDGSLRDTVYFSIIKPEWPALKKTIFSAWMQDQ